MSEPTSSELIPTESMPTEPIPTELVRRGVVAWPSMVVAGLIRGRQLVVSPWYGPTCRYYPSCSSYALVAVRRHGVLRGGGYAAWRLLRCNPWSPGGVDHVPERKQSGNRRGGRTNDLLAHTSAG
jgi:uncharacterized protein